MIIQSRPFWVSYFFRASTFKDRYFFNTTIPFRKNHFFRRRCILKQLVLYRLRGWHSYTFCLWKIWGCIEWYTSQKIFPLNTMTYFFTVAQAALPSHKIPYLKSRTSKFLSRSSIEQDYLWEKCEKFQFSECFMKLSIPVLNQLKKPLMNCC